MRRVVVAGSQGSGKTTLALQLGRALGVSVIHGDVLYYRPGWKPSEVGEFRARVSQAIARDGWVLDGSFDGLALDLTIAAADTFIFIERSRWQCLWRVLWRSLFDRDPRRPDLPDGCREMLDWALLKQTWRYNAVRRPEIERERAQFGAHVAVVRLSSDREIAAFLQGAGVSSSLLPAKRL